MASPWKARCSVPTTGPQAHLPVDRIGLANRIVKCPIEMRSLIDNLLGKTNSRVVNLIDFWKDRNNGHQAARICLTRLAVQRDLPLPRECKQLAWLARRLVLQATQVSAQAPQPPLRTTGSTGSSPSWR
jgi:hypothetical protein